MVAGGVISSLREHNDLVAKDVSRGAGQKRSFRVALESEAVVSGVDFQIRVSHFKGLG